MPSRKHDPKRWKEYYDLRSQQAKTNPLLRQASQIVRTKDLRIALDLGCGAGQDTLYLLKKGYKVYAIDAQANGIALLKESIPRALRTQLKTRVQRFENIRLRDLPRLSLVNASFSIFFCRPSSFQRLWRNLVRRMEPGSVFCGQFIGLRDSWAKRTGMTAVSKRTLLKMLEGFEVIKLSEKQDDSGTITGLSKHWHVYSIVAKRR